MSTATVDVRGGGGDAVPYRPVTLPALVLVALCGSLAQTIVIAALPAMATDLQVSHTSVTWALTAFMLAAAVATPIAGRLGDLLGYRRVLIVYLGLFLVGSLVCVVAVNRESLGVLLAGRVLQGLSGGVFPLAFGVIRFSFPPERIAPAVGVVSAMFGVGGAVGMIVAGPLVDLAGLSALFWVSVVICVAALGAVSVVPDAGGGGRGGLDATGVVLSSGLLVCLLLAISQGRAWGWASAPVLGLLVGFVTLTAAWIAVELRHPHPLVDLRLLRSPVLTFTNLAAFVIGAAMFGSVTLVPQFVQAPELTGYGFGLSATGAGLVMIPLAVFTLVGGAASSRVAAKFGANAPLRAGALFAVASFGFLAFAHSAVWMFCVGGAVVGAGYGLAFASLGQLVVAGVQPHQTGEATGFNTIVRTVGGAVGAQLAAVMLATTATAARGGLPSEAGYRDALLVFAAIALVAFVLAGFVRPRPTPAVSRPTTGGGDRAGLSQAAE